MREAANSNSKSNLFCCFDFVVQVQPSKKGSDECKICFYTRRGSIGMGLAELIRKKQEHEPLRSKFKELRAANIQFYVNAPAGKKPRHEKVDTELLTRKEETSFVTFTKVCLLMQSMQSVVALLCCLRRVCDVLYCCVAQDYSWKPLKEFCDKRKPDNKFKTEKQRRHYVENVLKLEVTLDENGDPGVAVAKDAGRSMPNCKLTDTAATRTLLSTGFGGTSETKTGRQ